MTDDTRQERIYAAVKENLWPSTLFTRAEADAYWATYPVEYKARECEKFGRIIDAADAIGRERVSAEMVNAAVEAFNAVTQQRTGKSLYGTWWPYEYLPAMKAALESALLTAAPAERGNETEGVKP